MASDAQQSGPLPGQKFTMSRWVQIFGAESGIHGDANGSAFGLTLPPASDVAEVGSSTLESVAIVGGFPLIIPAGMTQSLEIPPSTNASVGRTDLIVARLDTANFTSPPGPVRLQRFAGTEGSTALPTYDPVPPSPDTLPLWAVTRKQGESLNQAAVRDLRAWTGPVFLVASGASLPQSSPLGSRATRDGITYRRAMVGSSAQWVAEAWPVEKLTGEAATAAPASGWQRQSSCEMVRHGEERELRLVVTRGVAASTIESDGRGAFGSIAGQPAVIGLATLHDQDKPPAGTLVSLTGRVLTVAGNPFTATGTVSSTGAVTIIGTAPNISLAWSAAQEKGAEILLEGRWRR